MTCGLTKIFMPFVYDHWDWLLPRVCTNVRKSKTLPPNPKRDFEHWEGQTKEGMLQCSDFQVTVAALTVQLLCLQDILKKTSEDPVVKTMVWHLHPDTRLEFNTQKSSQRGSSNSQHFMVSFTSFSHFPWFPAWLLHVTLQHSPRCCGSAFSRGKQPDVSQFFLWPETSKLHHKIFCFKVPFFSLIWVWRISKSSVFPTVIFTHTFNSADRFTEIKIVWFNSSFSPILPRTPLKLQLSFSYFFHQSLSSLTLL